MATVNKDFRIKAGLVVEGANATVDGEDIITTGSTTDVLPEGTTNLYFTAQRAADAVADEIDTAVTNAVDALTTSDIEEGTNLYFTAQRAADAVADEISDAVTTAVDALDTDDIEEGSTNLYFTNQRAIDATASAYDAAGSADNAYDSATGYTDTAIDGLTTSDIEEGTNLYFTDARALTATALAYDAAGAAADAEDAAKSYADGLAVNYDAAGSAATAEQNAKDYADGLAVNYDAAGMAAAALTDANDYTDGEITTALTTAQGYADTVETNVRTYIDGTLQGLTVKDSVRVATSANINLNTILVDGGTLDGVVLALGDRVLVKNQTTASENGIYEVQSETTDPLVRTYDTDTEYERRAGTYALVVEGTLAATGWVVTGTDVWTQFSAANEYTAGDNIAISGNAISVTGLDSADISDFSTAALSATASAYDAAGAAATAEQNAKDYADETFVAAADLPGQLDDYVLLTEKGEANGVATLDANGKVPATQLDIDVTGDITTAIDALTTDDIEEGALNYYFTSERVINAVDNADIAPLSVTVGDVSKQVAASEVVATASTVTALSWAKAEYVSAKLLVKVVNAADSQVSEVLVTLDASDNVAITEFAMVQTDGELATVTADVSGTDVRVRVTTLGASSVVTVFGTLLV